MWGPRRAGESRGHKSLYWTGTSFSYREQTLACLSNWAHNLTQGSGEAVLGMNVAKVRHTTLSPTLAVLRPSEGPCAPLHALSRRQASSTQGREANRRQEKRRGLW